LSFHLTVTGSALHEPPELAAASTSHPCPHCTIKSFRLLLFLLTRLSRPSGGFVLWCELPAGVDPLRLNCGLPWTDAIETALKTLGPLAQKQL
jgi:DNA-binding transcriptional MocR family regulator